MKRGLPLAERFWLNVKKGDGCWKWRSSLDTAGYGRFFISKGHFISAHRFSFELAYGKITNKLHVLHRCDNPPCINPSHLYLGTHTDNMRDMAARNPFCHAGERNSQAKLNIPTVIRIREMYKNGGWSHATLAKEFGLSKGCIDGVVSGRTWKVAALYEKDKK